MNDQEIRRSIAEGKWYHDFEVLPGYWTGGQFKIGENELLDGLGLSGDLGGAVIGDVGAWDGATTFALEKRGAQVVGMDIQDPDKTCFNRAKKLRDSKARYIRTSVYDLSKHGVEFDAIVYNGVFYHLKYPILSFEEINRALKPGGTLHFSGECLLGYAETIDGSPPAGPIVEDLARSMLHHAGEQGVGAEKIKVLRECLDLYRRAVDTDPKLTADVIRAIGFSKVPFSGIYPGYYKEASNWHTPNPACVDSWCRAAGFRLDRYWLTDGGRDNPRVQTFLGVATKVGDVAEEHPLVGETMWIPGGDH